MNSLRLYLVATHALATLRIDADAALEVGARAGGERRESLQAGRLQLLPPPDDLVAVRPAAAGGGAVGGGGRPHALEGGGGAGGGACGPVTGSKEERNRETLSCVERTL